MDAAALQLESLVWDSGDRYHLDTQSLVVCRGAVVAVVAKPHVAAALADVVVGLSRPFAGSVLAAGTDVTGGPPDPRLVALLPAGGGLLPHLDAGRNIALALPAGSARTRRADLHDVAVQLRLEGALRQLPRRLSPEQRIRVAAARALVGHPVAVVVEDWDSEASSASAVRALRDRNAAILLLTDSSRRAAEITARVHTVPVVGQRPVTQPETEEERGGAAHP